MREGEEHLASPCDIRATRSQKCATNRGNQSYRDVEELLFVRGVLVTYEAIRTWCRKFSQQYANQLRHRRPRPGDERHLDEVFLTINGERHYLWRAVDQDGNVLAILVQSRQNKKATKKFFRKLLRAESIQSWSALVPLLPPDKITPNKLTTPFSALVYVCRRCGVKAPCRIL